MGNRQPQTGQKNCFFSLNPLKFGKTGREIQSLCIREKNSDNPDFCSVPSTCFRLHFVTPLRSSALPSEAEDASECSCLIPHFSNVFHRPLTFRQV